MTPKIELHDPDTISAALLRRAGFEEPVMAAVKSHLPEPKSTNQRETSPTIDANETESSRRRMPESLKRHLIRMQGGKYYLPAAFRIVWFRDECPDWGVETALIEGGQEAGFATVQARVYNSEGRLIASGLKTETRQDFPAGWVEKAETGSIARALALAGFGTQFAPELDDDGTHPADSPQKVRSSQRIASSVVKEEGPKISATELWEGPGLCPHCHAPIGKRHGKPCVA